jgi:3-dehydroquinate dehydratase-2
MANILLINGPNLNLLGTREPGTYGTTTLPEIEQKMAQRAKDLGHEFQAFQSNSEAELVDHIQKANHACTFIIFVHAREEFRQRSYFSDIAVGTIIGLGPQGYELALLAAHEYLQIQQTSG